MKFTNRADNKGDREVGVAYTVVNHDGTAFDSMTPVGTWMMNTGLVLLDADYEYVWPTADGAKPDGTAELEACEAGYERVLEAAQSCVSTTRSCSRCAAGKYSEFGWDLCITCPAGQVAPEDGR